jgi:uncharacterized phiE125 gp8 family phage protein
MNTTSSPAARLVTPPAEEPVSMSLVKTTAAIDADLSVWDEAIGLAITAARRDAEHRTGRKFVTQIWDVVLDAFPAAELRLPLAPVSSVMHVIYLDPSGAQQTLSPAAYVLDTARDGMTWLLPAAGSTWPATHAGANAVTVRCVAGYGNAAAVPAEARQWIALKAASSLPQSDVQMTAYVDGLLDGLRVWGA